MPIGPSFLAAPSHGTLALRLYIHGTTLSKLTYITSTFVPPCSHTHPQPIMSRLVLAANIYSVAVVPLTSVYTDPTNNTPLPTNRLISSLVLPNLTSFLYHSSFLTVSEPLLSFSFFLFFGTRNQNPPLPHVIPILVFARSLSRISFIGPI
ncbi:hypothetical protein EDB83DRAFT_2418170 [Lactarius deliciosus]|nr:hypothetical protein EDB83DRAFT_2418170 [Lactarius deliciosus]